MTAVITSAICASEFALLETAIKSWEDDESEDLLVNIGGFKKKAISLDLEQSIERFLNNTANAGRHVYPEAKESLLHIDEFAEAYVEFKRMSAEGSPLAPSDGSHKLWTTFRGLIDHFKSKTHYPRPQSIETLEKQGVSRTQIGSIYGWVLPSGGPDLTKISEELANPGTHYKPDEWQHPGKVNRQQIIDTAWKQRGLNRSAIFGTVGAGSQDEPTKFVPPSLDEMVRVGAPAAQIANVHKISVEEAQQLLLEAGTEPKREIVPANAAVAHLERMMAESNSPPSHGLPLPSPIVNSSSKLLQEI